MKREIKFRAWDGTEMKPPEMIENWPVSTLQWAQYEVMQFTGLKDKNGVEIYEGDVLKATDPYGENEKVFEVEFLDGAYQIDWNNMFNGGESDITAIGYAMMQDFTFEVIGNIYEHPSLITPKQ